MNVFRRAIREKRGTCSEKEYHRAACLPDLPLLVLIPILLRRSKWLPGPKAAWRLPFYSLPLPPSSPFWHLVFFRLSSLRISRSPIVTRFIQTPTARRGCL